MVEKNLAKQVAATMTTSSSDGPGASQRLPNIFHAESKEECLKLTETKLNRLAVFKFYSAVCQACKRITPRFDRLTKENPDVDFVFVEVSPRNKKFIIGELGIPSLPYGGIYHPDVGLIETMSISPKRFSDFEAIFDSYRDQECQLLDCDEHAEVALFADPYQRTSTAPN